MASTKEYRDFILEQLSEAPNITCRPMMGEFLLYSNNVLFGGIYDDRLLVKIVPENKQFEMPEVIPYDGSKKPNMVPSRVGLDSHPQFSKSFEDESRRGGIFSCRSASYGRARHEKCRIGGFQFE